MFNAIYGTKRNKITAIKITGVNTFGKRNFKIVCDTSELTLINLFGFGLWLIREEVN